MPFLFSSSCFQYKPAEDTSTSQAADILAAYNHNIEVYSTSSTVPRGLLSKALLRSYLLQSAHPHDAAVHCVMQGHPPLVYLQDAVSATLPHVQLYTSHALHYRPRAYQLSQLRQTAFSLHYILTSIVFIREELCIYIFVRCAECITTNRFPHFISSLSL